MKHLLILQLCALALLQSTSARTWTSADGRELEAEFVSANRDAVTVRKGDGTVVTIARSRLSPADREFVRGKIARPARGEVYPALITGAWEKANFGGKLPYRIFGGRAIRADRKYPLVIYLHGIHLRGSDNEKHLTGEAKSFSYARNYRERPCFIIAPQCPGGGFWAGANCDHVIALVKDLVRHLPVDPRRIYITGYSMGGYGTWHLLEKEPGLFAAAIPVAGGGDPGGVSRYKDVPIWAFHGNRDIIVRVSESRKVVEALRVAGGKVRYTEFKGAGHLISGRVYKDEQIHRWLFEQKLPE
jgi:predicted peptidase